MDLTIDPKLHCRPEHVGQLLYSGRDGDYIYNVTATSLAMHSIVLYFEEEAVTCGSIFIPGISVSHATVEFKSGVFGRIYISETQSEYATYIGMQHKLINWIMLKARIGPRIIM